jgi:hypothetical protein
MPDLTLFHPLEKHFAYPELPGFELASTFGILKTGEYEISETGSVPILR